MESQDGVLIYRAQVESHSKAIMESQDGVPIEVNNGVPRWSPNRAEVESQSSPSGVQLSNRSQKHVYGLHRVRNLRMFDPACLKDIVGGI